MERRHVRADCPTIALSKPLTAGLETTDARSRPCKPPTDLLSSASCYSLTAYLGTSATEVDPASSYGDLVSYACREQDGKVIGLWGHQADDTLQRESLITVQGKTVKDHDNKSCHESNDYSTIAAAQGGLYPCDLGVSRRLLRR